MKQLRVNFNYEKQCLNMVFSIVLLFLVITNVIYGLSVKQYYFYNL